MFMTDDASANDSSPDWLLAGLIGQVPGARSAVLLSSDGLVMAASGIGADDADRLASCGAALCSIARGVGRMFGDGGTVRQVLAELDGLMLFVSDAGHNSVLAVLAGRDAADPGVVGYQMAQLVKSVQPFLEAQPRMRGVVDRHVPEPAGPIG
jgi:predicted regulator of Ras-like GTPase activity (Roadblock/LC7/MglB family)